MGRNFHFLYQSPSGRKRAQIHFESYYIYPTFVWTKNPKHIEYIELIYKYFGNQKKSKMIYKTSLDNLAKGVTIGITLLFAVIIIGQYSNIKDAVRAIPNYTTVALLLIYFIPFVFRPIIYEISIDKLIIHRLLKDININRNLIKSVELIDKEKIGFPIRTFGVGGFFGYYGKFSNKKIGSMTWYATRLDKFVLIKTVNNKKIILTPDEPERFVANFTL